MEPNDGPVRLSFEIVKGMFAVVASRLASAGRLIIETPFGEIQSRIPGVGIGSLAFGILTFGLMKDLKAASADLALLDDGTIDYNDLKHGVFELVTRDGKHYVIENVNLSLVVRLGSGAQEVTNTPQLLVDYHADYLRADDVHSQLLNDAFFQQWQHAYANPTSTGTGGSEAIFGPNLAGNNNLAQQFPIISAPHSSGSTEAGSSSTTGFIISAPPLPPPPAPTIVVPPPQTLGVNQFSPIPFGVNQPSTISVSLSESVSLPNEIFTVTLTDSSGQLSATGASGNGTNILTISGSLSQVNAALATLSDTNSAVGVDNIAVNATNSLNNGAASAIIPVTVNGPPVISVPDPVIGVGQTAAISGVSISETGNTAGETFTVALTDTHGVLAATGGSFDAATHKLTISGSLSQVNADLTTLSDTNGTAGTDNITVQATDSFNNSATPQTVGVTVNGAPGIAGPSQILHMSQSDPLSGVSVSETGNTAGETFMVTLHDGTGILSATGGSEITGNGSHDLTITGNLLTVNSDLATLQDAVGAAGNATVTVNVSDGFGNSATPKTIAIIDATTVSETVSALSGNENTAILLNGISVSDTPSTGDTLTTTLAVSHGNITVAATSGVTIGGNDSGSVTLTGTAAAIDAALANTSTNYTGDTNYYGADSLTVTTTDPSSISSNNTVTRTVGITLADTTTVSETVSTLSGNENTAILLNGISVSDTPNTGDTLTTTLAVSHGNITVAATSGVTIGGNDSGSVTLTGTAAAIDAALANTSTNYTGDTNYYGADSLTVTTTDPSSISSNNTVTRTVGITLADTTTVSETVSTLSGNENTAILLNGISVSDTPNTGDTLTTTLAVSHGNITVAATSGVTIGGNDSGSVTLTGTAAAIDAALASPSTNYTGDTNYYGADSLTVTTTDPSSISSNNTVTRTVGITLADTTTVSETVSTLSGNENTAILLNGISVSDTPNTGDTLTTTLAVSHGNITVAATSGVTISDNDSGSVTLTGTAAAIDAALASPSTNYTGDTNYYGPDSLTVTTTDPSSIGSNNTVSQTVGITLADTTAVAETVSALSGNENTAILLNGHVSVSDTPNTGDTLTTTLAVSHGNITVAATSGVTISDNDSGLVTLTGTAAAIDAALASTSTNYTGATNYYGADSLTVTTTDPSSISSNNTVSQTVGITLADTTAVAETVSALSGNENTAILLNGHVSVSDTPNTGDTLTTTLAVSHGNITVAATSGVTIGGNDSGSVTLTGTAAAIDAALASPSTNYTGDTNYYGADSLTVTTTDPSSISSNNTVTQTVGITLADTTTVSETVSALSGNENTAISLKGHVSVSDTPNTTDIVTTTLTVSSGTFDVTAANGTTVTYSDNNSTVQLVGTAAEIDAALAATNYQGNLNFYGTDNLTVTTTDATSGSTTGPQTATITLADTTTVAETVSALSGNENTAISLDGHVSVWDRPNTGDTLTTTLAVSHGNITVVATSGVTIGGNDSGSVTLTGTAAAIDAALANTSTNYTGDTNYYGPDSLTVTTTDPSSISSNNTITQTVGITLADTTMVSETVSALSGNENTAISLNGHVSVSDTPNTTDIVTTTLTVSHGNITVAATSGVTIGGNDSGLVTLTGTAAAIDVALAGPSTNYTSDTNYYGLDSLTVTTTDPSSIGSNNTVTQTATITLADTTTVSETFLH